MRLIDITRIAQEAPIYPGSNPIQIQQVCDMAKGGPFNASMITMGSHMGTHADAFCHFLPESDVGIDRMPLEAYYGPCRVLTVKENTPIAKKDLVGRVEGAERIAIHGGGYSYLQAEAARYLVEQGIKTVVTDAWSVAPLDNEAEIHGILLRAGVALVENVTLEEVADGDYLLAAFPVKLKDCDGAPVRAVLIGD